MENGESETTLATVKHTERERERDDDDNTANITSVCYW